MSGDRAALEARELAKRYDGQEALKGVGFEAGRGERVAIIGPNGGGKTTLLSILALAYGALARLSLRRFDSV